SGIELIPSHVCVLSLNRSHEVDGILMGFSSAKPLNRDRPQNAVFSSDCCRGGDAACCLCTNQRTNSSCVHCGPADEGSAQRSITSFSSVRRLLAGLERSARSARASNRSAVVSSRRDL